jgi:hypothetical protein
LRGGGGIGLPLLTFFLLICFLEGFFIALSWLVEAARAVQARRVLHGVLDCLGAGVLVVAAGVLVVAAGVLVVAAGVLVVAVEAFFADFAALSATCPGLLLPFKLLATKTDMQNKPTMNNPPVIGFSHSTACPNNPVNSASSRSPSRYLRCALRIAR